MKYFLFRYKRYRQVFIAGFVRTIESKTYRRLIEHISNAYQTRIEENTLLVLYTGPLIPLDIRLRPWFSGNESGIDFLLKRRNYGILSIGGFLSADEKNAANSVYAGRLVLI